MLSCLIEHHLFDKMAPAVSPSNSRGHCTLLIDLEAVTLAQTPALEDNIWLVLVDDLGIVIADNVFFPLPQSIPCAKRPFCLREIL